VMRGGEDGTCVGHARQKWYKTRSGRRTSVTESWRSLRDNAQTPCQIYGSDLLVKLSSIQTDVDHLGTAYYWSDVCIFEDYIACRFV